MFKSVVYYFVSLQDSQVQCKHLLVKHIDSRRASSWRQETITRSKEEALEELKRIISAVKIHLLLELCVLVLRINGFWACWLTDK